MNKWYTLFFLGAAFVFALFLGIQGYYALTADFWPSRVQHPLQHNPDWETPLSEQELGKVRAILEQPFTYLDRGAQSFVFLSQDQKYVLKLFKFKHLRLNSLEEAIPEWGKWKEWKEKKRKKREEKYQKLMLSYKKAYSEALSSFGLLYCHLNPTKGLFEKPITLRDKLGIEWKIPADSLAFVLQKKMTVTEEKIDLHLKEKNFEGFAIAIEKLLNMYFEEYQKGFVDHDHWVLKNTGFDGEIPSRIDIGNLYEEKLIEESHYKQMDICYVGWTIVNELKKKDYALSQQAKQIIERWIEERFSVSFSFSRYEPYSFWNISR